MPSPDEATRPSLRRHLAGDPLAADQRRARRDLLPLLLLVLIGILLGVAETPAHPSLWADAPVTRDR